MGPLAMCWGFDARYSGWVILEDLESLREDDKYSY
jgi:hypothetical protein